MILAFRDSGEFIERRRHADQRHRTKHTRGQRRRCDRHAEGEDTYDTQNRIRERVRADLVEDSSTLRHPPTFYSYVYFILLRQHY